MKSKVFVYVLAVAAAGAAGYFLFRAGENPEQALLDRTATSVAMSTEVAEESGARVGRIARDLEGDDPARARVARADLAALPYADRNLLGLQVRKAVGSVRDELAARLVEMDDHLALDPLPVSLHVKDKGLAEIITILNEDLGTRMEGIALGWGGRYSIDADNISFWELLMRLNAQSRMNLAGNFDEYTASPLFQLGDRSSLSDGGPGQPLIKGSFCLYTYWDKSRINAPSATLADYYRLGLIVGTDPRLRVIIEEMEIEPLNDDTGAPLYRPPAATPPAETGRSINGSNSPNLPELMRRKFASQFRTILPLAMPGTGAVAIPSLKVKVHVVVSAADEYLEIRDVESRLNEAIQIGETTFTLTRFEVANQLAIACRTSSSTITPYIRCELLDSSGRARRRWTGKGICPAGAEIGAGPPYTLRVWAAQRTRETAFEMELRDIPLPQ